MTNVYCAVGEEKCASNHLGSISWCFVCATLDL